jgi:hypothetical protein
VDVRHATEELTEYISGNIDSLGLGGRWIVADDRKFKTPACAVENEPDRDSQNEGEYHSHVQAPGNSRKPGEIRDQFRDWDIPVWQKKWEQALEALENLGKRITVAQHWSIDFK